MLWQLAQRCRAVHAKHQQWCTQRVSVVIRYNIFGINLPLCVEVSTPKLICKSPQSHLSIRATRCRHIRTIHDWTNMNEYGFDSHGKIKKLKISTKIFISIIIEPKRLNGDKINVQFLSRHSLRSIDALSDPPRSFTKLPNKRERTNNGSLHFTAFCLLLTLHVSDQIKYAVRVSLC